MNLVKRELAANIRSTLIWAASLTLLGIVFLSMLPAFTQDVEASRNILSNLPSAVRDALNISLETFFSVYGFFAYLLTFVTLAAAVQAMNFGVSLVSKETSGKTDDFLLTKPITRSDILSAKLMAGLLLLIGSWTVFSVGSLIAAYIVSDEVIDATIFLTLTETVLLVQLFFFSVGFLLSVIIPKIKSVIAVSLPVVFSFFIIGMVGDIVAGDKVRYLTPFKFFDSTYIISNVGFEAPYVILEVVVVCLSLIAGYLIYDRKDIKAAS